MAIVPQHAVATADADGDATFVFPVPSQGALWCGTTQMSGVPSTAVGVVTASGEYLGDMYGPGSYGPWTCNSTQTLRIAATGLTPGTQYQAVWHADSEGAKTSTYPAPITPVAVTGGGTVNIGNFPAIQTVDGTVDIGNGIRLQPGGPVGGQTAMTGSPVTLPSNASVQGVTLSAPSANAHPIILNGGYIMESGQTTPLWPISDLDLLTATGTSPDVLSWMVT